MPIPDGPLEAHVSCDDCGNCIFVMGRCGPRAWFLKRKSAPGWRMVYTDDGKMTAKCPQCLADDG